MQWWDQVVDYYKTIGEKFDVNPLLFVGIHIVATPLFGAAVAWILYNRKKRRPLLLPSLVAAFIFNAANIYLVIFGRNIPWWIYGIAITLAVITGFISFVRIRNKVRAVG